MRRGKGVVGVHPIPNILEEHSDILLHRVNWGGWGIREPNPTIHQWRRSDRIIKHLIQGHQSIPNQVMPVLEFAVFTLHPPHTPSSATVKSVLNNALAVLTSASGHPFTLLTQIESPNTIYLIGTWDSVPAHNSFLASAENQKLLADAKDVLNVDVMYHVEMGGSAVPLGAPVVAIGRHHVKPGMKAGFDGCFGRVRGVLRGFTGVWEVAGGWRVDEEEEGKGEWLLFTGWESVAQHEEFGKSEEFKEYAGIKEFLEGFEVRHAVKYEV